MYHHDRYRRRLEGRTFDWIQVELLPKKFSLLLIVLVFCFLCLLDAAYLGGGLWDAIVNRIGWSGFSNVSSDFIIY